MIFESAKSKITNAFCAISSSSANTRSSSSEIDREDECAAEPVLLERVMGFLADDRRRSIPSVGEPKILSEAILSAFAIAAVPPLTPIPTNASGEPGNRSIGELLLRGEEERYDN